MAWNRLAFTSKEEVKRSISDLASIYFSGSKGELEILGTAFPIANTGTQLLMLTAFHVVEYGYKLSNPRGKELITSVLDYLPGEDNQRYLNISNWLEGSRQLKCAIYEQDNTYHCDILGACIRPPLDMSLLVVDISKVDVDLPIFRINTDILDIGEEVVITSFKTKNNSRELVARHGFITERLSKGRLVNAPIYRTNIPVEAGASGGPVFRHDGILYGDKEVVGVITNDFSSEESFLNNNVDGESYISIMASASPLGVKNADGKDFTFKDLCENNVIKDSGSYIKRVQLKFHEDGNWEQKFPK